MGAMKATQHGSPMKSLEFGPGLEKAKLEPSVRHAIRCVGDCRWGEAIVPPEEVNEGAYAQLDDVFGNNVADLGTRQISDTETAPETYTVEGGGGGGREWGVHVCRVNARLCSTAKPMCATLCTDSRCVPSQPLLPAW